MRLSAKGRYGLAAMTHMAMNFRAGAPITIIRISERLGISKIYLEQVFSLLKRAKLVLSVKGSQGGYLLARAPETITAYDILEVIELTLVETTAPATSGRAPALDEALNGAIYAPLDRAVRDVLSAVTLADLVAETERRGRDGSMMFYI